MKALEFGRRRAVTQRITELEHSITHAPRVGGSFCCSCYGPKGPKTTSLGVLGLLLSSLRGEATAAVDANPDEGTLRQVIAPAGSPRPAKRLIDLIDLLEACPHAIRTWEDLDPLVQTVGRLHLVSNEDAAVADRERATAAQYGRAFEVLRSHAPLLLIDQGRSQIGAVAKATLAAADHLIVPCPAYATDVNATLKVLDAAAHAGHAELVSSATIVITALQPGQPADALADGLRERAAHVDAPFAAVHAVPYDPALPAVGRNGLASLAAATRLAYLELAWTVAQRMSAPRLSARSRQHLLPPEAEQRDEGRAS